MASLSIAVAVCHYEQPEELKQCLRSITCQLRPPEQILVVDDASHQPPQQSALETLCSSPVRLLLNKENNGGPAIPRNQAVHACHCSHLVFLDADDILMPNALQSMESAWKSNPSAIAYGDQICWGTTVQRPFFQRAMQSPQKWSTKPQEVYEKLLMGGNRICLSGSGGPAALLASHPFDPKQRWEDYDLWLRLAKSGTAFKHTGEIHTLYRLQEGSRSGSRQARHQGCNGIKQKHLSSRAFWRWPRWYWKQRFL